MIRKNKELTAWLDGEGPRPSRISSEDLSRSASEAAVCGDLLRKTAPKPEDPGARFNAQILAALRTEKIEPRCPRMDPLARFAWGGASLLAGAALWMLFVVPHGLIETPWTDYFASVTRTRVAGSHVSAVPVGGPEDTALTVVWIDGLDYMRGDR